MDTLEKLRVAYGELKVARRCVELAEKNKHDPALVFGHTGFANQHLDKAMKLIEEVGRELKKK